MTLGNDAPLVYEGPRIIGQLSVLGHYLEMASVSPQAVEIRVSGLRNWMNLRREADRGGLLMWQNLTDPYDSFLMAGFRFVYAAVNETPTPI